MDHAAVVPVTGIGDIHRIGGGDEENLRLKPREATLDQPGISVLRAPSPGEAARQIRETFPDAEELHQAARVVGSATADNIRSAGFDLIANPNAEIAESLPDHPPGWGGRLQRGESSKALKGLHQHGWALSMSAKRVKIIDLCREVVATAEVTERGECFAGLIDLSLMPASLREIFEEYEEIVNGQMFSLLDEIEDRIGTVPLKVVFEGGSEASVEEIQVYPSTRRVSFRLVPGAVRE